MEKIKLRRHESFPIREGWLEKGLNAVAKEGSKTFSKEHGVRILGIGSNMVKSLKYWMMAGNIIMPNLKCDLTDFGECLLKYDTYLETNFSLCLYHYFLSTNEDFNPVGYFIINNYDYKKLIKEEILNDFKDRLDRKSILYNENSISEDINMFFRLYTYKEVNDPEDNYSSVLSNLGLLQQISPREYEKTTIDINILSYLVVFYAIQQLKQESFNISDLYITEKSPAKVFNLDRGVMNQYLNILRNKGYIIINRTAGLNSVYLNKKMTVEDLFEEYFGGVR